MKSRFWLKIIVPLLIITLSSFMEGITPEDEDSNEGEDWDLKTDQDEIQEWWQEFKRKFNYPLYCLILALLYFSSG